jgi:hypothetical protein
MNNLDLNINEIDTRNLILTMIEKFDKKFEEMNEKFDKKLEEMNEKFDKKLESLESEIKILKLTQDYINETGNSHLQKPLDSVSLASFLSDEKEENSYFKLFR